MTATRGQIYTKLRAITVWRTRNRRSIDLGANRVLYGDFEDAPLTQPAAKCQLDSATNCLRMSRNSLDYPL